MHDRQQRLIRDKYPLVDTPAEVVHYLQNEATHAKIAIACSGGADSVFLVLWFCAHFEALRGQTLLLHYNHNTRAAETDADESFVHQLGEKCGIQVCSEKRSIMEDSMLSEANLREARFDFFRSMFERYNIKTLLTGHHLSDKIETLLMRLSRGSSLDGLVAPIPKQRFKSGVTHVRPVIRFKKEDIVKTLTEIEMNWREDSSNNNNDFYRNYLRNELLPKWSERCPQKLFENIGQSCALLQEDADALNKWAESTVQSINLDDKQFPLSQNKMLPDAINRRCILMWLNHHQISENLSVKLLGALLHAQIGETFAISSSLSIRVIDNGNLELKELNKTAGYGKMSFHVSVNDRVCFPDGHELSIHRVEATDEQIASICKGTDNPSESVHVDAYLSAFETGFRLIFWEPGMRYTPLGLEHTKKLHDCFINRKIPMNKRQQLPVIINRTGEILWVPGLLPSEKARVNAGSKSLLRLTYKRT